MPWLFSSGKAELFDEKRGFSKRRPRVTRREKGKRRTPPAGAGAEGGFGVNGVEGKLLCEGHCVVDEALQKGFSSVFVSSSRISG
jgi:hypothetical protein